MKHVAGYITIVQEGRFRLTTDNGRGMLFTSKLSALDDDVHRYHAAHRLVDVSYEGEPDYKTGVAETVTPMVS